MIYINGIRASKKDLMRLLMDVLNQTITVSIKKTKKGNIAIIADF